MCSIDEVCAETELQGFGEDYSKQTAREQEGLGLRAE